MTGQEERRKYKRLNESFNVKISQKQGGKGATSINVGKSQNISACGILLKHDQLFEVGSLVNVNFLKPNSFDIFNSDGKVVRADKNSDGSYDLAIEFHNLSGDDIKTLDYLLSK